MVYYNIGVDDNQQSKLIARKYKVTTIVRGFGNFIMQTNKIKNVNDNLFSGAIAYLFDSNNVMNPDVYSLEFWKLALQSCKPGSFLFCFGENSAYRIACAVEDAGWQIKESINWINAGAHEPIIVAMKPLEKGLTYAANAQKWNVAGLNIDSGRIGTCGGTQKGNPSKEKSKGIYGNGINGNCDKLDINKGRWPANIILSHSSDCVCVGTKKINEGAPEGGYIYKDSGYKVEGFVKTCKPKAPSNRGQETVEVYACVPDCPIRIMDLQSGHIKSGKMKQHVEGGEFNVYGKQYPRDVETIGDSGGASRFFYCAKNQRQSVIEYLGNLIKMPGDTQEILKLDLSCE